MDAIQIAYCSIAISLISLCFAGTLAWIRVKEYKRDSKPISTGYFITGDPNETDKIFLTNLSSTPVVVDHWQLLWREKVFPLRYRYKYIKIHADEDLHMVLKPRERKELEFGEEYNVNWHPKNMNQPKLFIELHLAGKKVPLKLLVY